MTIVLVFLPFASLLHSDQRTFQALTTPIFDRLALRPRIQKEPVHVESWPSGNDSDEGDLPSNDGRQDRRETDIPHARRKADGSPNDHERGTGNGDNPGMREENTQQTGTEGSDEDESMKIRSSDDESKSPKQGKGNENSSPKTEATSNEQEENPLSLRNSAEKKPTASTRLVMVTDLWERMVNVQLALRFFLIYALEHDFTLVEPFVYESKVMNEYSLPEHFRALNMEPQPASTYFDTSRFLDTGRLITHDALRQKIQLNNSTDHFVIDAAVFIPWDAPQESHGDRPFYWCDEEFDNLMWEWPKSEYGRAIVPGFHLQRMVCLNPVKAADADESYFDDLFSFVRSGSKNVPRQCEECVSVSFINYRKYLLQGMKPSNQRAKYLENIPATLPMGEKIQSLARRVKQERLGNRGYVGIQMRTGKAFTLLGIYEDGHSTGRQKHSLFHKWLKECSGRLVQRAKELGEEIGEETSFYMASDIFNSGWKGGEYAPDEVVAMQNETIKFFEKELGNLHWFEPEEFGVRQDAMGISGAVDAAVTWFADRFVYSTSSFGLWISTQRMSGGQESVEVKCEIPEFGPAREFLEEKQQAVGED